jgi:flagellar biosynthesis GTPase FlhF
MKNEDVNIGQTYSAKITDKVVPVRIDAEHKSGGWHGTNMTTNRKVHIKSARKLRGKADAAASADKPAKPKPARKKLTAAERKEVQAKARAKQTTDAEPAEAKPAKQTTKTKAAAGDKKMSLIDAAIEVLRKAKQPMNCKEMVNAVFEAKLWAPGTGKTPHATLCSAILRDLKSETPRFEKVGRGQFQLAKGA